MKCKIFLWCEVVIAARILLFTIPVILNKFVNNQLLVGYEDRFIAMLTIVAFFYLIAGLASLVGHSKWKLLHYIITIIVCFLSYPFLNAMGQAPNVHYYFLPAIFSIIITCGLFMMRGKAV